VEVIRKWEFFVIRDLRRQINKTSFVGYEKKMADGEPSYDPSTILDTARSTVLTPSFRQQLNRCSIVQVPVVHAASSSDDATQAGDRLNC